VNDETEMSPEPEPTIMLDPDPVPQAPSPAAPADTTRGFWECLNEARLCSLAAPDARTPGKPFEGPTQNIARNAGEAGRVRCPECASEHVVYRGDKVDAGVPA
jgi:hypothetical protein